MFSSKVLTEPNVEAKSPGDEVEPQITFGEAKVMQLLQDVRKLCRVIATG
jgi:hypothetical protein